MVLESGLVEEQGGALVLKGALRPLAIPDNLQEVLVARLSRLATARAVARLGAVIGREFGFEMLREVAALDDAALAPELERLIAVGLLFRRGLLRRTRYVWKHALVQEALVQSIVKRQRRQATSASPRCCRRASGRWLRPSRSPFSRSGRPLLRAAAPKQLAASARAMGATGAPA
jgi:predicted ATPase